MADAVEIQEQGHRVIAEEEDVINNLAVTSLDELDVNGCGVDVGEAFTEKCLPFLAHQEHQDSVASGSIDRAKGHDIESPEDAVGAGKAQFFTVTVTNFDLVEARLCVDTDPIESAAARGEIVNSFVASGDGEAID